MTENHDRSMQRTHSTEKADVDHLEYTHHTKTELVDEVAEIAGHSQHIERDVDHDLDPAEVKRITRKIDWRLIPILAALYTISLIDRTNLSLARQANNKQMNKDLRYDIGQRFSITTIVFFIPYIILEVPSQIGLRKFGARWWLGGAVIAWGLVMVIMGYVQTWQALAGLRALLGAFESTLFPGAAYLIACWYPRKQMATRNVFFYVTSIVISGLGSILAYGISQMHGRDGKAGWRWIFIITGSLTVFIGILGVFGIVDFPDKAKFLTHEEREIVITRIQRDRADAVHDPLTWAKFMRYISDPKIWIFGYFFGSTTLGSYSLSYFLPVILAEMGFSNAESQLLVAPPYVYAAIPAVISAVLSDRTRKRFPFLVINACLLILGTCLYSQLPHTNKAGRYAGIFLAVGGCNSNVGLIVAWAQTSIRSQSKRAAASALIIAWGGIGGILAGVSFMEKEAKKGYPTGVFLTIAMNATLILLSCGLAAFMRWQNKRASRGEVVLEGHPEFRYQF